MGGVVCMVFILLPLDPTPFRAALTLVAIFNGYIAFSGSRAFSHPRIGVFGDVRWRDFSPLKPIR
jgi:hypothetical protein